MAQPTTDDQDMPVVQHGMPTNVCFELFLVPII